MLEYTHRTRPFAHQDRVLRETWDRPAFALFWEQGTGKTKTTIDTAAALYRAGEITGVLVVAPSSVHINWATDEIPTHLPEDVLAESRVHVFQSSKSRTNWHKRAIQATVGWPRGLSWMLVSYDGLMTEPGKNAVWRMLRNRRCLYVLDESMYIKTPSAKRSLRVWKSGQHAPYRRALCGTPSTGTPFDLYTQIKFLEQDFWERHLQIDNALAFRHHFGVMRQQVVETPRGPRTKEYAVDYRNLEQLRELLEPISSRVLKEDVLDLPPKLYSRRSFEMQGAQRRVYEAVRDEFMVELDSGELVTTSHVLTRMLRLQQITCGYLPTDNPSDPLHWIDGRRRCRRLDVAREWADDCDGQAIVWAQWNEDVDALLEVLGPERCARFDGQVSPEQRERNKRAFKVGDRQFFVSKPSAAGTGHTLTEATSVLYYNNSFNLVHRLQSEDRAHRIGQDRSVLYTDVTAVGSLDERVVQALRDKFDVASQITGDVARGWLQ